MNKTGERCTFAIISHPDAGKTTITEKLLWFGQVVRDTGMVKAKGGNYAKSDWMELEKQRGISVTSSVMSFGYEHRQMHLLDTPGHKDFSEDTYRTLTAVESVLMMIDSAKGVEAQTIKLMEVCRMRDTPIITFMNKFDRESLDPFELLDNVEKICSIQCVPMTWPIGHGVDFKGVIDLKTRKIQTFDESNNPFEPIVIDATDLDSPEVLKFVGEDLLEKLKEDLEMIEEMLPEFSRDEFLAGIQTPVFFGTALHNFGVKEVLDSFARLAPGPAAREAKLEPFDSDAETRVVNPSEDKLTGFVFKIQANMDKNHRDRMSFLRVCSGHFSRGEKLFHVRSGKEIKINTPMLFQSRDRELADEAFAGDIVGINGSFQIGDTFTKGEKLQFTGIPSFAPELFMRVLLKDPLKGKHLEKGLIQLSEEGAVQLFIKTMGNEKILGAVGTLQFDVVKFRLEDEYNVKGAYEAVPLSGMRWLKFPDQKTQKDFEARYKSQLYKDSKGRLCFGMRDAWDLKMCQEKFENVGFFNNSDYKS